MTAIIIAAVTLLGCTVSRWYFQREDRRQREWLGGWVRLTHLWNDRGPFDLPLRGAALKAVCLAAVGLLAVLCRRHPVAGGIALGGGLSNTYERFRYNRVLDYLRFPKAPGALKKYVWNLADFALLAGVAAMLLSWKDRG